MNSFKPKTTKTIKVNKKRSTTLDEKHIEFINQFAKDDSVKIPELKKKRRVLQKYLLNHPEMTAEEKLDIQDQINDLTTEIKTYQQTKKDYYLENSNLIFDYFENKKSIAELSSYPQSQSQCQNKIQNVNNETNECSQSSSSFSKNNLLIKQFFKIKTKDDDEKLLKEQKNMNIVQQYLSNVDDNFLDINSFIKPEDICNYCFKGELIPLEDEGVLICNLCSRHVPYLIDNEKPSYKEAPKEICFYAYKRINHFKEIIAQFQGKETTQIPKEVIENIKIQIKKERIDLSQLTNLKTKEILKKLGYNKYYEHIPFIKDKLGIKPPIMSQEFEDKLFNLFMELQRPYSKFCPDDRVNFLNYYYTAYKLCELLDETQYLDHFPMLKDREKRIEQDAIWKQICEELDWEFIPTL